MQITYSSAISTRNVILRNVYIQVFETSSTHGSVMNFMEVIKIASFMNLVNSFLSHSTIACMVLSNIKFEQSHNGVLSQTLLHFRFFLVYDVTQWSFRRWRKHPNDNRSVTDCPKGKLGRVIRWKREVGYFSERRSASTIINRNAVMKSIRTVYLWRHEDGKIGCLASPKV